MSELKKLGRYEILGEIGRGGMGIVYKGLDPKIKRNVALKVVKFSDVADEAGISVLKERFYREAQAVGKLSDPAIVTIFDVGEEEDFLFIAMEYVDGKDLNQIIKEKGKLKMDDVLKYARQIAEGLDHAHREGIVHRDIKPGNILIDSSGQAKITDFGLARLQSVDSLTKTGHAVGTPSYMSPEQFQGGHLDGKTDLYSLGVLVYEMLTAERPFVGDSFSSVMFKIMKNAPVAPSDLNLNISPSIDAVIFKLLTKKPSARFQTGKEFIEALEKAVNEPIEQAELTKEYKVPPPPKTEEIREVSKGSEIERDRDVTSSAQRVKALGKEFIKALSRAGKETVSSTIKKYSLPKLISMGIAGLIFLMFVAYIFSGDETEIKKTTEGKEEAISKEIVTAKKSEIKEKKAKIKQLAKTTKTEPLEVVAPEPVVKPPEMLDLSSEKVGVVKLRWKAGDRGSIKGYNVYRGISPKGPFEKITSLMNPAITSHDDKVSSGNQQKASIYYYQLTAIDKNGKESLPTKPKEIIAKGGISFPPIAFRGQSGLPKTVMLTWEAHPYRNVFGYYIYRGKSPGKMKRIAKVTPRKRKSYKGHSIIFGKLEDGTTYYYKIIAFNARFVSSHSEVISAKTKVVPQKPTGLSGQIIDPKQVSLKWNPNPEKDIKNYNIERKKKDGGQFSNIANSESTSYVEKNLKQDKEYLFRIQAIDKDGLRSPYSDSISIPSKP